MRDLAICQVLLISDSLGLFCFVIGTSRFSLSLKRTVLNQREKTRVRRTLVTNVTLEISILFSKIIIEFILEIFR